MEMRFTGHVCEGRKLDGLVECKEGLSLRFPLSSCENFIIHYAGT